MAWPISFNLSNGVGKAGTLPSLLAWGTDGMYTSVIVKTIRASQMIEEVKIEQGSGLTATDILIYDGDEVELTVVDDRAITFPLAGGTVTLVNPQPNGTGGTSELFQVINNNYTTARKVEGERTMLCKRYLLITPVSM
jgi:hypothetical protein